jgi:hypothetical protein
MRRLCSSMMIVALALATVPAAFAGGPPPLVEPPAGPAAPGTFRFAALGDMGTGDDRQFAVAARLAAWQAERPFDDVLLLGDNIYSDGNPRLLPARFEKPYAPLLARGVQFHAVLGNHDVDRGRNAEMAYKPFNMSGHAYYSFTAGGGLVELFGLDSTAFDDTQAQWLDGALGASHAKWKIVFVHHPLYSSARRHGSNARLRVQLEPVLVRHGVALVLTGHDHVYERTRPQRGIVHVVAGAGGALRRGDLDERSTFLAAGNDQVNSFVYLEASGDALKLWAVAADGKLLDFCTITQ